MGCLTIFYLFLYRGPLVKATSAEAELSGQLHLIYQAARVGGWSESNVCCCVGSKWQNPSSEVGQLCSIIWVVWVLMARCSTPFAIGTSHPEKLGQFHWHLSTRDQILCSEL